MSSVRVHLIVICVNESDISINESSMDLDGPSTLKGKLGIMFGKVSKSSPDYQSFKLESFEEFIGDENNYYTVYYSTIIPKIARREDVVWESIGDIKNDIVKKALLNI